MILAIDPGPEKSGMVIYDDKLKVISHSHKLPNSSIYDYSTVFGLRTVLIEYIDSVSNRIGLEVINTAIQIGRFHNHFGNKIITHLVGRKAIKTSINCKNDSEVRKYLINKYGKEFMKKLKGDCTQAFAIIDYYLK